MTMASIDQQPLLMLDTFDFDERMPNIVADHGRLATPVSNASDDANDAVPFMLGDYSEKEHFLPSSSLVRNEVLEGVPLSEIAGSSCGATTDTMTGADGKSVDDGNRCMAFRCIFCKDKIERAEMAVIRPQNLMEIQESFIRFQQVHLHQCTFIPNDIRKCYAKFKSQEAKDATTMMADDRFLWVSSAIRRGLRDKVGGGILYCSELLAKAELESSRASSGCHSKRETKKKMKLAGRSVNYKAKASASAAKVAYPIGSGQTEKIEILEVMNLFKEEIGEWTVEAESIYLSPAKKQKLVTSRVLEKNSDLDWKMLQDVLNNSAKKNKKKAKTAVNTAEEKHPKMKSPTSNYNGVSRSKRNYDAKFSKYRLGCYKLEADAALAYDGLVRASGWKSHYVKINFATEAEYVKAREAELKTKGLEVGLEKTLAYITLRVNGAAAKIHQRV